MYGPSFVAAAPGDRSSSERSFERALRSTTDNPRLSTQNPRVIGGRPIPELLEALRAGDEDALTVLHTELFGMLWSVAVMQTRSRDTAKDIVQDVFFWLWTRRNTLKIDTDIHVYLVVAVRNRARNLRRHSQVVDAVEHAVGAALTDAPGIGQRPLASDAAVEEREFYEAYQRALRMLSERERVAALLRWEEGFTLEQIGEALSLSTVGARKVLIRAQTKVQKGLEAYRG
jgi:RNA polymerase sigma-70 factor (ECF subfamily)